MVCQCESSGCTESERCIANVLLAVVGYKTDDGGPVALSKTVSCANVRSAGGRTRDLEDEFLADLRILLSVR
jgi:hypothetical protein